MKKRRFSKIPARLLALIMLGCALCIVAPANRVATTPSSVATPAVSPTPERETEVKQPNPVRRLFSSVIHGIAGVFRGRQGYTCALPPFVNLTTSSSLIRLCPPATSSPNPGCSSSREVTLIADAPDPEANPDPLLFTWAVTGGRLSGEGRKVTWYLGGLPEGTYTATVEINDGNQHTSNASTSVTVAACPDCITHSVPCPTVSVSCPSVVDSKQPVVFDATIHGGDPTMNLTYTWSVTAGKITGGQGTPKITVDASHLDRQSVTATVSIGGFPPLCSGNIASCTILELRSQPH